MIRWYICTVALLKSCITRGTVSGMVRILVECAYHGGVAALPGCLDALICRSRECGHYR